MARTMPAINASQLNPPTTLGAATNMAIVRTILTISRQKNPSMAMPAFDLFLWRITPRANKAAGITTASAP